MNKKEEFIQRVKHQLNVELENDKDNIWNKKRNILYTRIPKEHERAVLQWLEKKRFIYNEHLMGYYWINL